MKMRSPVFIALCLSAAVISQPAVAQSVKDKIVAELKAQGFTRLSISRTWLGRTRILATDGKVKRELVFNGNSGEILRDYSEKVEKSDSPVPELLNPESKDGGGSDSGKGGDGGHSGSGDGGHSGGDGGHSGGGDGGGHSGGGDGGGHSGGGDGGHSGGEGSGDGGGHSGGDGGHSGGGD